MDHRTVMNLGAIAGAVAVGVVTALIAQFNADAVPLPKDWRWAAPVIVGGLVALVAALTPQLKLWPDRSPEA